MSKALDFLLATQCGGIHRKGVDIGLHYARAIAEVACARSMPVYFIFLGLVGAFARVRRELLFTAEYSDERIVDIMRTHGLPADAFQQ
eukprot:14901182-Alexandrium_andersonii.AAC.1